MRNYAFSDALSTLLKAGSIARPRIVNDPLGITEFSINRHISEVSHRIVEFPAQIHGINHQAGTICSELAYYFAVRLDKTRWIWRIIAARIRHANPEMVRRGMALHRLAHNVRMDAGALLAGVVEGLENAVDALLVNGPIQFRETQIKAYQQRAFHAVDCEVHKSVARRQSA